MQEDQADFVSPDRMVFAVARTRLRRSGHRAVRAAGRATRSLGHTVGIANVLFVATCALSIAESLAGPVAEPIARGQEAAAGQTETSPAAAAAPPSQEAARLQAFRESPGITEVTSVNRHGAVVGRREREDVGGFSIVYFTRPPAGPAVDAAVPDSFTHIELGRLSDSGWIAGYATRPLGDHVRSQQALVLNAVSGQHELLPVPDGYRGSCAFDLSADGRRVSGFVNGREPPRLEPAVWSREGNDWRCDVLPCPVPMNPLLTTAQVVISDDGQVVAASVVQRVDAQGLRDYRLTLWRQDAAGRWQAKPTVAGGVHLADVNDRGQVAGRVLVGGRRRPFFYDPERGERKLPVPAGSYHVSVTGLNAEGDLVGTAEDPPGPEGGSHAVLWVGEELREIPFGVPVYFSTANTLTDDGRIGGLLQRVQAEPETGVEAYVLRWKEPVEAAPNP
jgi:hypothetical protein